MGLSWLVEALVSPFIKRLGNSLLDGLLKQIDVGDELANLQTKMVRMGDRIMEFEGCKVGNTDEGLLLLTRLTEAMYDSEDVLRDCSMYAENRGRGDSGRDEQLCLPRLRHKLVDRIRKIIAEVEEALSSIEQLPKNAAADQGNQSSYRGLDSYEGILTDDIVGLRDEIAELLKLLTTRTSRKIQNNVYVITGMAGIGKTTLAKMFFHSPEVRNGYGDRIWVQVTKHYQDQALLRLLVEKIDNKKYDESFSKDYLLGLIERRVQNLRLLVVLDDCWSADVWENLLRAPLSKAAEGSAVVITTRKKGLAKDINAHEVSKETLSIEHGCELLRKAWSNLEECPSELENIDKRIVSKCKGHPVAIKAIGKVLKSNRPRDWDDICSSDIWNNNFPTDIMPALLLSYMDLPYYLKLCFLHCSFFPENFNFHCKSLVQLWMAQGFVDREDTGAEYYKELIARNLLVTEPSYYDDSASKMHNIMHVLAKYVSSRYFVKHNQSLTCHLYHVDENLSEVPDINETYASCLRSLVLSKNPIKEMPECYLKNLSHLRVLDLSYTSIKKVPLSLENLLQLRLINLSFTPLVELPESITRLRDLQSLQLYGANDLVELPQEVTKLTNLRCLTLGGNNARLDSLPTGIGQLQDLRRLRGFLVNQNICNLVDLEKLSLLTELTLYKLDRVGKPEEAERAVLQSKTKLTHLHLSCNSDHKKQFPSFNNIEQVFEKLRPPKKCISIHIDGYFGKAFPSWMSQVYFGDLEWLRLENCKFCTQLPPLGQLPKLKVLDIRENSAVTKIGSEFTGTLKFPLLEELYFIGLDKLQEWSGYDQRAFPCLKKLEIIRCLKLQYFLGGEQLLTSLRELTIAEGKKIKYIKDLPYVRKLCVRRNPSLEVISDLANVDFMNIRRCNYLHCIEGLQSLRHLVLSDDKIKVLPAWLTNMTPIKRLDLEVHKILLERIYMEKVEQHKFQHVDRVEVRCYMENRGKSGVTQERVQDFQNVVVDSNLYVSYTRDPFCIRTNLSPNPSITRSAPSSSNAYMTTWCKRHKG